MMVGPAPSVRSTATGIFPSAGNHFDTGSLTARRLSSSRDMMPTPTIGLVIEAIAKIASFGIGTLAALSR